MKTRDCVVSVVGTVFSVKAEAAGSRVAVIEGEVHVQHGDISQTLLPGQQVATNTEMKAVPIQSEIGWSQDAAAHVALLRQAIGPVAPPAPPQGGTTAVDPDLLGQIRLIAAPVDQGNAGGAIEKNKTFFNFLFEKSLDAGLQRQLGLPHFNWATPPNGFTFVISGIQGRTISFSNSKNETFSYGCADCSFVVSENGVSKTVSSTEPGIEFKLSVDGNTLTATCHSASCSALTSKSDISISRSNPAVPQTFAFPTSQLTPQQGGSVVFVVTKPAGQ